MRKILKIFFIVLYASVLVPFFAFGNTLDSLKHTNKSIIIASEPDYPPYCIVDKNGNADGFSIDLFKAAAKAVGIDVKIKVGVWDQIKQELADGKIDALPLVGRTPEREEFYDFTMPYLRLHGAIFIHKDTKDIKFVGDILDKTIAVMKGDNAEEYARRNGISKEIITTHTFEEAFRLLDSKDVDAVIVQKVVGLELVKNMNLKSVVSLDLLLPDFRQDFCFAVKKGNTELLSQLNEGLSIIIANKRFDEIHHKWFGPKFKEVISAKDIVNIVLQFVMPIMLFLSLVFIVILRRIVRLRTSQLKLEVVEHKKTYQLLEKMELISKVGGWNYDIKTKNTFWTKGVYSIHGVNPDEFDPQDKEIDINFYNPGDREIIDLAFNKLITTGEPYDLELRLTDANGIQKWVWTSGQAEFSNGEIVRVFGSIMDITESKLTEISVMENELRMRNIFNSTNEAIIIHDANTGNILDCNDSTLKIYGYSTKEEILGKSVGDISINEEPYNQEEALKRIREAIERGTQTFEWICKKKDGTTFWSEVSLRHVELNTQNRILAVVRDTSERKKSEFELVRLNNEIQAIFKASKPLQYLTTPETLAFEIIQVLEDVLKYEHGAVLLKNDDGLTLEPFAVSDQGKGEGFAQKDKEYIRSKNIRVGEGIVGWVAQNGQSILLGDVTKDPRYFPMRNDILSELCVPIIWESNVIGVMNIESSLPNVYNDTDLQIMETMAAQMGVAIQNANLYQQVKKELNERKAAEQEVNRLNEELELIVEERTKELAEQVLKLDKSQRAMLYMIEDLNDLTEELKLERQKLQSINKELESFSYSVSHDLRAPLRAIDGFSRILIEDYSQSLDDEGNRLLGIIRQNSQKMDKLITDLLALSRVTRNEMNLSKIDMASMANSMFYEVVDKSKSESIDFKVEPLPNVFADSTLMRQVWQNLIGNAIKYSKPNENARIVIEGKEEDNEFIFSVKDNGVGFNQEYAHKIFETFQRLHRSDEFEGTGIGLSIVQRVVHRHGGRVWAQGKEGEGATFWFSLPKIS